MSPALELGGQVLNWTVSSADRIGDAMSTGAQWEIWLQVEMALHFRSLTGGFVLREQKYDGSQKSVDILLTRLDRLFAIELKTESTMTGLVSGMSMLNAIKSDQTKLQTNPLAQAVTRLGCKSLSGLSIGIGSISQYRTTAQHIVQNGLAASVQGDFGVYIVPMDIS